MPAMQAAVHRETQDSLLLCKGWNARYFVCFTVVNTQLVLFCYVLCHMPYPGAGRGPQFQMRKWLAEHHMPLATNTMQLQHVVGQIGPSWV
jgi:hypothetical protein